MPGRRRTGSRPSSTSMSAAVYIPSDKGAPFLLPPLADLDEGAGLLSSSSSLAKRSRDVADLRIASKKPEAVGAAQGRVSKHGLILRDARFARPQDEVESAQCGTDS